MRGDIAGGEIPKSIEQGVQGTHWLHQGRGEEDGSLSRQLTATGGSLCADQFPRIQLHDIVSLLSLPNVAQ